MGSAVDVEAVDVEKLETARGSSQRPLRWGTLLATVAFLGACTSYVPFDSGQNLEQKVADRLPAELAGRIDYPFEIGDQIREAARGRINPAHSESRRTQEILDFIFGYVGLEYALTPTRNADAVFAAHEGNCLSFVNLFVGLGREYRLNPFYVEVRDYQRWNYQNGVVVSRGHIVGGMYVDGQLSTFDFLPYKPKSYKDFEPVDDLTAMAHHYNNLGAEALMREDTATALENLEIAVALAPAFDKARNNLGIVYLRQGDADRAIELYEDVRQVDPDNVPILTNLARAYQQAGRVEDAKAVFDRLEEINQSNPFFYVYRGDMALARGDTETAMEYMRKAFKTDTELPEVHLGLVRVYLALGRIEEAQHHVERALKLDATHEEARKYAAMIHRRLAGSSG